MNPKNPKLTIRELQRQADIKILSAQSELLGTIATFKGMAEQLKNSLKYDERIPLDRLSERLYDVTARALNNMSDRIMALQKSVEGKTYTVISNQIQAFLESESKKKGGDRMKGNKPAGGSRLPMANPPKKGGKSKKGGKGC